MSGRWEGNNFNNSCGLSKLRFRTGHERGDVGDAERDELTGLRVDFSAKLNSSNPSMEALARVWKSDEVRRGTSCGDWLVPTVGDRVEIRGGRFGVEVKVEFSGRLCALRAGWDA